MKAAEILKKLADRIDAAKSNITMKRSTPVEIKAPKDIEGSIIVPLLQAKLKLLKKSVGARNIYAENNNDTNSVVNNPNAEGLMPGRPWIE